MTIRWYPAGRIVMELRADVVYVTGLCLLRLFLFSLIMCSLLLLASAGSLANTPCVTARFILSAGLRLGWAQAWCWLDHTLAAGADTDVLAHTAVRRGPSPFVAGPLLA
eukprot:TRINITY_DN15690_c0_g1_i1.p2 TRINITY_DN15690_c0_g1~~TRINITY_DN15690_c0_g1_i1.p2  ORF type:complete len:109 (+),score=0.31 TRINITY_DN15690_c0_g1_i1:96-422(+)